MNIEITDAQADIHGAALLIAAKHADKTDVFVQAWADLRIAYQMAQQRAAAAQQAEQDRAMKEKIDAAVKSKLEDKQANAAEAA